MIYLKSVITIYGVFFQLLNQQPTIFPALESVNRNAWLAWSFFFHHSFHISLL